MYLVIFKRFEVYKGMKKYYSLVNSVLESDNNFYEDCRVVKIFFTIAN